MDVCRSAWSEGRNSSNVHNNYGYESDRSQQYVPTLYGNKQNSVQGSYNENQSKRKMVESVKQLTKHQRLCMTEEEDEEKQIVLQKNGGYALTLLKNKNMVLGLFKGNVYAHFWDNRNKKHVSLNCNELSCLLTNRTAIGEITELLKMEDKQETFCLLM